MVYSHGGTIYDTDSVALATPSATPAPSATQPDPESVVTRAYERGDDAALARAILALYRSALLRWAGVPLLPLEAKKGPRSLKAEQDRRAAGWSEGALVWIHNQASTEGVVPLGTYPTHYGPCWVRDDRIMSAECTQDWVIYRTREAYLIARLAGCVARVFFGGRPAHNVIFSAVREYDAMFPKGPGGWSIALPELGRSQPMEVVEL